MVRDALRGYLAMANGLTEVPRRRAAAAAKALIAQGEATAEQVSALTEDLLATSRSNRDALTNLIRYEIDRTLDQMGLVTADKLRVIAARVATLESAARAGAPSAPAKKAGARKASAKQAAKRAASKAPARKAARKAPAKKAPARKAAAKKSATKTVRGGGTS